MIKQTSMLTGQVIRDGLSYILRGGLRIENGHIPPSNHKIADDFFGVCVASNANQEMDVYVIAQLNNLGIRQVRLDFTYGDLSSFNARFLRALIAAKLNVTLHIIQPFAAAKNMQSASEQAIWREFLQTVLDTFGAQIKQIEIGTTINRKRWAGYSFDGFLMTWQIAYKAIKARNITLVGPNVQDFEPLYNVSLLKKFRQKKCLPDIHSNNLFSERTLEPERFDHRVFKYSWATFFKYNLVKKARLLQKIGQDFGVGRTISSAAFWAVYRIKRQLPDAEQKQADYAVRYFALLAASGSLSQANWGAFICEREGLINNAVSDNDYPALEQVAHYASVQGKLANFKPYPSFFAVKVLAKMLAGAHYVAPIATAFGLEIHHFQLADKTIHIAWSINGKVAFLDDIYHAETLANATIYNRDGKVVSNIKKLITESPIYLCWATNTTPQIIAKPVLAKDLVIHAHAPQQYFRFLQDGWHGLILANNQAEADLLAEKLNPDMLLQPTKDGALRHARNAIWAIVDPRDSNRQLTIKQPVKMYPHKAFLDRFKPSKAKRSWNGAMELMRRGVGTAQPVAYFEKIKDSTLKQNYYICEFVQAEANIGKIFSAIANGEAAWQGIVADDIFKQLAQFCWYMHQRLMVFRDLSGGNVLVNVIDNQLQFTLIDTARLRCVKHTPFPRANRLDDMARVSHKLDWPNRKRLMAHYFALIGSTFTWQDKMSFYLYDAKVSLKRTIGRKGIKRLIKRFRGQA